MREYSIELSRMLAGGIRRSPRQAFSKESAHLLQNLVASTEGVKVREPVVNPFTGVSLTFPFPQFFKGTYDWLLCTETAIYSVNKSTFSLTLLNVIDINTSSFSSIPAGGRWHFIDLHNSWFLFNGECVVWRGDYDQITDAADLGYVYINTTFKINTACVHKGRIVFGGFDPNQQWSIAQQDGFEEMASGFTVFPDTKRPRFEQNFVAWTSIGDGSFLRALLIGDMLDVGPFGEQTGTNWSQFIVEALTRGDFGFMAMPYSGRVEALIPSADGVVAYGTNGVAFMNEAPANELFTGGYGVVPITHVGIHDRGSAISVGQQQLFLGSDGALYSLGGQGGLQFLDYQDTFGVTVTQGKACAMAFDAREGQVYINFENSAYIYTPGVGLSKSGRIVSFVERIEGNTLYAVGSSVEAPLQAVTNSFDMDSSALKTITTINLGMNVAQGQTITVQVDYRYQRGSAYQRSSAVTVNKEGNVFLRVTGLDFRVVINGAQDVQTDINLIEVRYQQSDKRYRRGPSDLTNVS